MLQNLLKIIEETARVIFGWGDLLRLFRVSRRSRTSSEEAE